MIQKILPLLLSFIIIAFGQPATSAFLGLLAGTFGFAIFFITAASFSGLTRFLTGWLFFSLVQLVQLSWLLSHPYSYIWGVYFGLSLVIGSQFGFIAFFATRNRLETIFGAVVIAASWTFVEWYRLFYFSGYTFNPVGLAYMTHEIPMQMASLSGIYGLSFLLLLTNCLIARAYFTRSFFTAILILVLPFAYGSVTLASRSKEMKEYDSHHPQFRSLIISSKILPEELEGTKERYNLLDSAFKSWEKIIEAILPYKDETFDLILFPEIVVPIAADAPIFPLAKVQALFTKITSSPVSLIAYERDHELFVSHTSIAQALSTLLKSPLLIGLEGRDFPQEPSTNGKILYYNSAFFIPPEREAITRYDKQILLPMAESIPYEWARPLAARYGLFDSFQAGSKMLPFQSGTHTIATSICYEDTFSELIRSNAKESATILTNLTNDGWYPNSSLGIQHLEHARVRAVENGLPLLRACNFGVSGAIDCLGRGVELIPFTALKSDIEATKVLVSTYTVPTLYSGLGDMPIVIFSAFLFIIACIPPSHAAKMAEKIKHSFQGSA